MSNPSPALLRTGASSPAGPGTSDPERPINGTDAGPADFAPVAANAVAAWVLYDLANTLFGTNVVTNIFPLWVIAEGGTDAILAGATGAATVLTVLLAPLIGVLTDRRPRRVPLLALLTVLACALIAPIALRDLTLAIPLYVLGVAAFQLSLIVYDALLTAVSTPQTRGRVSGLGVGVGYLGTLIAIGIGAGVREAGWPIASVFPVTAAAYLLLALPCFLWVRERPSPPRPAASDWRATLRTLLRPLQERRDLRLLLLCRILYGNVANTLILFTAVYATSEVGLSLGQKDWLLLTASLSALAGAFGWGRATDAIGAKTALGGVLGLWLVGLAVASLVPLLGLPIGLYWLAAAIAGLALGGTWAVDRTFLIELAPPAALGQTLGLYAMVGRFAGFLGPLIWAAVADWLGWGRPAAMASMLVLVVLAAAVLRAIQPPAGADTEPGLAIATAVAGRWRHGTAARSSSAPPRPPFPRRGHCKRERGGRDTRPRRNGRR